MNIKETIKALQIVDAMSTEQKPQPETYTQSGLLDSTIGKQVILVLDRGFVYTGKISIVEQDCVKMSEARNIRKWGTTKGLGQLAETGPTSDTVLDSVGIIMVPMRAIITVIICQKEF